MALFIRMRNTTLFSQRSLLTFMALAGIMNAYLMRLCLNLAILKTVDNSINRHVSSAYPEVFPHTRSTMMDGTQIASVPSSTKTFQMSEESNGLIKSAFFIGYALLHIPGSFLVQKYGGKTILNFGLLLTAVCTLVTPITVQYGGANGLITLGFFMGLCEAPAYPALIYLLSCWIPEKERGTVSSIVFCGGQIGSIIFSVLTGAVLEHTDGYATIFYTFGILGLLWNIAFHFLVYDSPTTSPRISVAEKEYLKNEIGDLVETKTFFEIPWKNMIGCPAVLVLTIVQIGHDWGLHILASEVPNYLKVVLHLQYAQAWYQSMPFIVSYLFSVLCGVVCDSIVSKKVVTVTQARKIFTAFGALVSAFFTLLIYHAEFVKIAVLIFYILAMGSISTFYAGAQANFLDLCPNYSGALTGLVNGTGAVFLFLAPYLTGLLTKNGEYWEWEAVFCMTSVILPVTLLTYLVWGSAEVQSWNAGVDVNNRSDKGKSTLTFVSLKSWKSWITSTN